MAEETAAKKPPAGGTPGPPSASERDRELAEREGEADMGVHLPGLFPEQDSVDLEEHELTASERRVLADIEEAVGRGEERPGGGLPEDSPAGPKAEEAVPAGPRGAALPPWYAAWCFGPALVLLGLVVALGLRRGEWGPRLLLALLGSLALLALCARSWRQARRRRAAVQPQR